MNDIQMMEIKLREEYEYKLENESVDLILNAMFGTQENTKEIQNNPVSCALFNQLKITTRNNLELQKEILELRSKLCN